MGTSIPITSEFISGQFVSLQGQPGYIVSENPPFHPNILNIPFTQFVGASVAIDSSKLYRGSIVTRVDQRSTYVGQTQFRINFLYNPSTIMENRSLDINNQVLPNIQRNPLDPTQFATGLNTTIGFSLLFDRTYELWDSSYTNTQAGTYGVAVDTNAFYNLVGINQLNTNSPVTTTPNGFNAVNTYAQIVQGPMVIVPADLYFGYNSTGALKYYGYISAFNITYTHFNQRMVPQRCGIQVSFTLLPDVQSTSSQPINSGPGAGQ